MRKVKTIFGAILMVTMVTFTSCGSGGKWAKLAAESKLTPEDIQKAIEVGTKMGDCYQLESAPGAMDSKMTEACDPFMKEYKDYCVSKFGTDEYSGDKEENKKVKAFREIMFDTRNEVAKSKQK